MTVVVQWRHGLVDTMDSMGRLCAYNELLVLGIDSEPGTLLGTGDPKEINIRQNKHGRQEGERPFESALNDAAHHQSSIAN